MHDSITWLTLSESLDLLSSHGVQTAPWICVETGNDNLSKAVDEIGFPLVAKLDVLSNVHKTDIGAVAVGISSRAQLVEEISRLEEVAKKQLLDKPVRIILQRMLKPDFELIIGLKKDNLGKVILVGTGGIFTELLKDISLRLCPITKDDAMQMLSELKASKLLSGYRGSAPVDMDMLIRMLLIIGGSGGLWSDEKQNIVELDLNPVAIVNGMPVVLDARIGCEANEGPQVQSVELPNLDRFFDPESVAFVGVSTKGGMASKILEHSLSYGYKGKVYVVNPNYKVPDKFKETVKAVPSIDLLPEPIDYALVSVRAENVHSVMQAMPKGLVKFVQILTSGFGEAGPEGKAAEQEIVELARQKDARVVGPNCLGFHSSESHFTFVEQAPYVTGNIGAVMQSGGLGADLVRQAAVLGVGIKKLVTVGNCADLGVEDFLEYFVNSEEIDIIAMYLEGIKDARRFVSGLSSAAKRQKQVVILHGGWSSAGAKAASSHTGALVTSSSTLHSVCRQFNAVYTQAWDDFLAALFSYSKLMAACANKLLLIGPSGGATVLATDYANSLGLVLPEVSQNGLKQLELLNVPPGSSLKNPIDTPAGTLAADEGKLIGKILNVVSQDINPDYTIMHINLQNAIAYTDNYITVLNNLIDDICQFKDSIRNLVLVLKTNGEANIQQLALQLASKTRSRGVPVLFSLEMALRAVGYMAQTKSRLERRLD